MKIPDVRFFRLITVNQQIMWFYILSCFAARLERKIRPWEEDLIYRLSPATGFSKILKNNNKPGRFLKPSGFSGNLIFPAGYVFTKRNC
jgi:hypothetical protein